MKQSFTLAGQEESIPVSSQAEHVVPLFGFQQGPGYFLISSTNMEHFEGLYCALPPWKHLEVPLQTLPSILSWRGRDGSAGHILL